MGVKGTVQNFLGSREHELDQNQAVLLVTRDKIIKDQDIMGTCNTPGRGSGFSKVESICQYCWFSVSRHSK